MLVLYMGGICLYIGSYIPLISSPVHNGWTLIDRVSQYIHAEDHNYQYAPHY